MPIAALFHQTRRFDRCFAGGDAVGIRRYELGRRRVVASSLGQHAMAGIAPGRDPDELAIALGHQHRVDVMVGACGLRIDACNEVMKRVGRPPGLIDFSGQTMREAARDRSRIVLRVALVRPRTAVYALMLLAGSSLILWSLMSHASILG
jgi:hypothetical protein